MEKDLRKIKERNIQLLEEHEAQTKVENIIAEKFKALEEAVAATDEEFVKNRKELAELKQAPEIFQRKEQLLLQAQQVQAAKEQELLEILTVGGAEKEEAAKEASIDAGLESLLPDERGLLDARKDLQELEARRAKLTAQLSLENDIKERAALARALYASPTDEAALARSNKLGLPSSTGSVKGANTAVASQAPTRLQEAEEAVESARHRLADKQKNSKA